MKLGSLFLTGALGACLLLSSAVFAADDPAGAFLATSLPGVDGHAHSIDDWKGKIRVVNFWATWCAPCRGEIPFLFNASRKWRTKGVEVIGIAIDDPADVSAFVNEKRIGYPILVAQQQGQALMQSEGNGIGALPFTLLLDRHGNILQRHAGALDPKLLKQWLADAAAAH